MGILEAFERLIGLSRQEERVDFKEILCNRWDGQYIKQFRTTAAGSHHKNIDGSERQHALGKLKEGGKVRMLLTTAEKGTKRNIYLIRGDKRQELDISECFGRLNDSVAADVIRWLTHDRVVTAARIFKLTGGTRKKPKLGCILECRTYPAPEEKSS